MMERLAVVRGPEPTGQGLHALALAVQEQTRHVGAGAPPPVRSSQARGQPLQERLQTHVQRLPLCLGIICIHANNLPSAAETGKLI